MSCIFCKIIKGEMPAHKVYEDDHVVAILDIYPINTGHVLVLPKQHGELLSDLTPESAASLMQATRLVEKALRATGLHCDATNLVINNGRAAGQEIPHVHLHIIPRFRGDGVRFHVEQKKAAREDLETTARRIQEKVAP